MWGVGVGMGWKLASVRQHERKEEVNRRLWERVCQPEAFGGGMEAPTFEMQFNSVRILERLRAAEEDASAEHPCLHGRKKKDGGRSKKRRMEQVVIVE